MTAKSSSGKWMFGKNDIILLWIASLFLLVMFGLFSNQTAVAICWLSVLYCLFKLSDMGKECEEDAKKG